MSKIITITKQNIISIRRDGQLERNMSTSNAVSSVSSTGAEIPNLSLYAQRVWVTDSFAPIVHNHDDIYYTQTELNNGQLNNIYYTETESNNRFLLKAGDTFTGLLTFDNLNGSHQDGLNLDDGNIINAYDIHVNEGGTIYFNNNALNYDGSNLKFKNYKIWNENNDGSGSGLDADLWDGYQFDSYLNQPVRTGDTVQFSAVNTTKIGYYDSGWDCFMNISDENFTAYNVNYGGSFDFFSDSHSGLSYIKAGGMKLVNSAEIPNIYCNDYIGSSSFVDGWLGTGWAISGNSATFDNITVRNILEVFKLQISEISAINGMLFITDTMQIQSIWDDAENWYIGVNSDNGNIVATFASGDTIKAQTFNGTGSKVTCLTVSDICTNSAVSYAICPKSLQLYSDPELDDVFVRLGNTYNQSRQGGIYFTSQPVNEYMYNGVTGYTISVENYIKISGVLPSITMGSGRITQGYGDYMQNLFMSGVIECNDGYIGGVDVDNSGFYAYGENSRFQLNNKGYISVKDYQDREKILLTGEDVQNLSDVLASSTNIFFPFVNYNYEYDNYYLEYTGASGNTNNIYVASNDTGNGNTTIDQFTDVYSNNYDFYLGATDCNLNTELQFKFVILNTGFTSDVIDNVNVKVFFNTRSENNLIYETDYAHLNINTTKYININAVSSGLTSEYGRFLVKYTIEDSNITHYNNTFTINQTIQRLNIYSQLGVVRQHCKGIDAIYNDNLYFYLNSDNSTYNNPFMQLKGNAYIDRVVIGSLTSVPASSCPLIINNATYGIYSTGSIYSETSITSATMVANTSVSTPTLIMTGTDALIHGEASKNLIIRAGAGSYYAGHLFLEGSTSQVAGNVYISGGDGVTDGNVYLNSGSTATEGYTIAKTSVLINKTSKFSNEVLSVQGNDITNGSAAYFYQARANESNTAVIRLNSALGYYNDTKFVHFYVAGTSVGYIHYYSSTMSFYTVSDKKLKKNITDMSYDSLSMLNKLRPVTYQWIDDNRGIDTYKGLIAQEVKKVLPEMVSGEDFLGLNYEQMHIHYIKAIQQLNLKIEKLEEKINGNNLFNINCSN
jgi:hypothetical protein